MESTWIVCAGGSSLAHTLPTVPALQGFSTRILPVSRAGPEASSPVRTGYLRGQGPPGAQRRGALGVGWALLGHARGVPGPPVSALAGLSPSGPLLP